MIDRVIGHLILMLLYSLLGNGEMKRFLGKENCEIKDFIHNKVIKDFVKESYLV